MKCPKCGWQNLDSARYCKKCGEQLTPKTSKTNNKLIITAIAIVIIILAGLLLYANGILTPPVELEHRTFEYFEMDVPEESDFQLIDTAVRNESHVMVSYENKADNSKTFSTILFGKNISTHQGETPSEINGNMKIYKTGKTANTILVEKDGYELEISGKDLETEMKMAQSYKIGDVTYLENKIDETVTAQKIASMRILGGSFTTGENLTDKTYASIYVGPEYAGENIIIQVSYSNDNVSLNNGEMIPTSVDSSGYINVGSDEAFKYFPDKAEVNLYDANARLLDSYIINLSKDSGTQTF